MEPFRTHVGRVYNGTHRNISPKHLHLYVAEATERLSVKDMHTLDKMAEVVWNMVGKTSPTTDDSQEYVVRRVVKAGCADAARAGIAAFLATVLFGLSRAVENVGRCAAHGMLRDPLWHV